MGRMIDDSVKQKLLDSLAEEPTMVLSTAYVYAKNYVMYGEDITKAWTTAVQQASILEQVKVKAQVEAYDSFKKEYENRLKADMVAMLTEIQLEIEEKFNDRPFSYNHHQRTEFYRDIDEVIQQKINALKGEQNDESI